MDLFSSKLSNIFDNVVSPLHEASAYEALWNRDGATFKKISDKFKDAENVKPSDLVPESEIEEYKEKLLKLLREYKINNLGIRLRGTLDYPERLTDDQNPLELFYFQGLWDLVFSPSVAVVGSRKVSEEGKRRTRKIVRHLVEDGFTIVSGLAEGVDTEAHTTALKLNGRTIGVIGTPLTEYYPKQNKELQSYIRDNFLLISQVPFIRYSNQSYKYNRYFFPERNKTMSALTKATIIIEASDTSGTLTQARAALQQGRKLFILNSCFENADIKWPLMYEKKGAIRVRSYDDIRAVLMEDRA